MLSLPAVDRRRNLSEAKYRFQGMKILTATATSQDTRENDFNHAIEGELVGIGLICATDQRDPDGGCGCGRAFFGLSSLRATTTAQNSRSTDDS
jgi:hypothetical protein